MHKLVRFWEDATKNTEYRHVAAQSSTAEQQDYYILYYYRMTPVQYWAFVKAYISIAIAQKHKGDDTQTSRSQHPPRWNILENYPHPARTALRVPLFPMAYHVGATIAFLEISDFACLDSPHPARHVSIAHRVGA